jgi:predicted transcriptional regulator
MPRSTNIDQPVVTTIRLPKEIALAVAETAEAEDRSVSWLLRELVTQGIAKRRSKK